MQLLVTFIWVECNDPIAYVIYYVIRGFCIREFFIPNFGIVLIIYSMKIVSIEPR